MGLIASSGFIESGLAVFGFVMIWVFVEVFIYFGKNHRPPQVPPVPRKTLDKYKEHEDDRLR